MNATGLSNFSALALLPLLFLFWRLSHLSHTENCLLGLGLNLLFALCSGDDGRSEAKTDPPLRPLVSFCLYSDIHVVA
jgi:hypothetical protein